MAKGQTRVSVTIFESDGCIPVMDDGPDGIRIPSRRVAAGETPLEAARDIVNTMVGSVSCLCLVQTSLAKEYDEGEVAGTHYHFAALVGAAPSANHFTLIGEALGDTKGMIVIGWLALQAAAADAQMEAVRLANQAEQVA